MFKFLIKSLLLLSFLLFFSCREKQPDKTVSFYYWKSVMSIGQAEMDYLDSLKVNKLYLRFFDVYWDKEKKAAVPISQLQWKYFDLGRSLEIIPVVYITNISLEKQEYDRGIDTLAKNIANKLTSMMSKLDTVRFKISEVQIDCDWSMETQSKYFRLLNQLKIYLPQISSFSATIRLHQVKYFTGTGVPPVDKGVLMFYNMGDVTKVKEKNSILNLQTAKGYLENFDVYPLKLDLALPLFSWGVQFREDKIVQLINDLSEADLKNNVNFKSLGNNIYQVLNSSYIKGIYVYKNDMIRLEGIAPEDLTASVKLLKKTFGNKPFDLIFYHLDDYIVRSFDAEHLKTLTGN